MLQRGFRYRMPEQHFATVGGNSAGQGGFFIWLQVVYNFLHIYIHIYISSVHSRIFASCIVFKEGCDEDIPIFTSMRNERKKSDLMSLSNRKRFSCILICLL